MSVRFSPDGTLDVGTDPSDLPSTISGKNEVSGAMVRCTNLRLDRPGMASTRHGSAKQNPSVLSTDDFTYTHSHESEDLDGTGYQLLALTGTGNLAGIHGTHAFEYTYHLTGATGGPDNAEVGNGYIDQYVHAIICQAGDRYAFAGDHIYKNEKPLLRNPTDDPWSGFNYNAFNSEDNTVFALNGSDRIKIVDDEVMEWGISAPSSGPEVSADSDYVRTNGSWEADIVESGGLICMNFHDSYSSEQRLLGYGNYGPGPVFAGDLMLGVYGLAGNTVYKIRLTTKNRYQDGPNSCTLRIQGLDANGDPDGVDAYTQDISEEVNTVNPVIILDTPYSVTGSFAIVLDVPLNVSGNQYLSAGTSSQHTWGYRLDELAWSGPYAATVEGGLDYRPTGDTVVTSVLLGQAYLKDTSSEWHHLYDWEKNILEGNDQEVLDSQSYRGTWFWELQSDFNIDTDIGICYTYLRKDGATILCESNPSPPTYIDTITSTPHITWAIPSDGQVTHVRIYRTVDGGAIFYYSGGEFEVGDGSGFVTAPDANLGYEVEYDHDRPPLGTICAGPDFNGYCFIAKDNFLFFCKNGRPEYWPATYYVEVGSPDETIQAMAFWDGILYIYTESKMYQLQGSGYQSFYPLPMPGGHGAINRYGVLGVRGLGIFHVYHDGLWLWNGATDNKVTHVQFEPIFRGEAAGSIPAAGSDMTYCRLAFYRGRLYFAFPSSTATYADEILVFDFATQRVSHYDYGREISALAVDHHNGDLYAADTSGYIWKIDDPDLTDDEGVAIDWQIESKAFTDSLRKYFPRAARYDVSLGSGASATGSVILNGSVIQSHTISTSRDTGKRLVTGTNGDRLAIRIAGSGPVNIYSAEVE